MRRSVYIARAAARHAEYHRVVTMGELRGITWVISYLRAPLYPELTPRILRAFGAQVGEGATFKRGLYLDNVYEDQDSCGDLSHLCVGARVYVGDMVYLDLAAPITLEDEVVLSGRVSLVTHADCNRSTWLSERLPRQRAEVYIAHGAWIGFGATVLAGVRVGECAVVGAHALLRKDATPRTIWGGVPAQQLRALGDA